MQSQSSGSSLWLAIEGQELKMHYFQDIIVPVFQAKYQQCFHLMY
jgi:hypothetical protein